MKIVFCLLAICIASALGEQCSNVAGCQETQCKNEDGWWLHCFKGQCVCNHDTYTGKPCADGLTSTCNTLHGSRCADAGLHWRCIDNSCHCTKY